jgi:8-oxo-dGTP pyrophosphatase MutT (NUDIX family)
MNQVPRETVIVFLHVDCGQFLLQLRDFKPSIPYPGHWGGFGGEVEPLETPESAGLRELEEELDYVPDSIHHFRNYLLNAEESGSVNQAGILLHIFYGELSVPISQLSLSEGLDFGLFSRSEIFKGKLYSSRLKDYFHVPRLLISLFEDFYCFADELQSGIRRSVREQTTNLRQKSDID